MFAPNASLGAVLNDLLTDCSDSWHVSHPLSLVLSRPIPDAFFEAHSLRVLPAVLPLGRHCPSCSLPRWRRSLDLEQSVHGARVVPALPMLALPEHRFIVVYRVEFLLAVLEILG
jgi:hypothetical protein